jgi:hypothetical protein
MTLKRRGVLRRIAILAAIAIISSSAHLNGQERPRFRVLIHAIKPVQQVPVPRVQIGPDECVVLHHVSVRTIVQVAYQVRPDEIVAAPDWVSAERFHVLATSDSPVSPDQGRLMLRNMLADRFKLLAHADASGGFVIDAVINPGGGFWTAQ